MSRKGDEITYWPLAHFPKSISRQRSLQNGNSGSFFRTGCLQVGHFTFNASLRGIGLYILAGDYSRTGSSTGGAQTIRATKS